MCGVSSIELCIAVEYCSSDITAVTVDGLCPLSLNTDETHLMVLIGVSFNVGGLI
jgi:hypothetical protein